MPSPETETVTHCIVYGFIRLLCNMNNNIPADIKNLITKFTDIPFNSNILTSKESIDLYNLLRQQIKDLDTQFYFEKLHEAELDGFDFKSFHYSCDDWTPTILIALNDKNEVYGGYTKQKWNILL